MSQLAAELKDEKKNKRKGATYSVILHALLLLIAIWPFLEGPADIDKNFAIVVEFEKPIVRKSGSSQKQSAASSSSEQANKPSETEPAPKRNVQEVERIEKTEIKPATQPIEEVLTAPDIEVPKWPEPIETPERIETTTPTKQTTPQTVEENSIDDFMPVLDKIIEEDEAGAGSTSGALGDSDFDPNASGGSGSGGSGKGEKDNGGVAAGAGTGRSDLPPGDFGSGDGLGGAGFDGEGPLQRRIKKRANCLHLVDRNAVIILDLCINRSGDITYSRYNSRRSTVKDKSYARDFTNCFRNTIFYSDNSAPNKECGTYKYTISGVEPN